MARRKVAAKKDNTISMIILGVVAVIAIVGLVLLFSAAENAGLGIYGGAIKGRQQSDIRVIMGTVQIPDTSETVTAYGKEAYVKYLAKPNYNPKTTVYSNLRKCPKGALFSFKQFANMDYDKNWNCPRENVKGYYDEEGRAGVCCYLTEETLPLVSRI